MTRDQIMAQLLGVSAGDPRPGKPVSYPVIEAQKDELRIVLAQSLRKRNPLKKGDFVRYIHRSGPIADEHRGKAAHMYWCELDKTDPVHLKIIAGMNSAEVSTLPNADCILVYFNQDGHLLFDISDSSLLERDE